MSKEQVFGWLLLALIAVLSAIVADVLLRRHLAARLALQVGVAVFAGFALAQIGVKLIGG